MYQKWCLQGLAFLPLIENAKSFQNADRGAQGKEADRLTLIIKSRMTRELTTTQMGCMHKQGGEDGRINLGYTRLESTGPMLIPIRRIRVLVFSEP
jgi:hypothetical protein